MLLDDWDYRVTDLLEAVKAFGEETQHKRTYNQKIALEYIWSLYNDIDTAIFIEYYEDKIAGFIICGTATEFQEESIGYISKVYVMPRARGTKTGRNLLRNATAWFDSQGCVESYATSTAGIGQDQAFINLLGKYGYGSCGLTLIRKIQHE